MTDWIELSKKEPDEYQMVLVFVPGNFETPYDFPVAFFRNGYFRHNGDDEYVNAVTHWQPIIKPDGKPL